MRKRDPLPGFRICRASWFAFFPRQRPKPFSSVVLFEDQSRSNPVPDEDDAAGSLVDAAMLSQYV